MSEISLPNKSKDSSEASSVWTLVGKVVAAVGGPVLGSLALSSWFRKHPLLALVLLALYETGVFCVGIVGEVWKRLKDRWLDAIAKLIDYRVQELVSGYRSKYLQHVSYECRDFDVKGLGTQGTFTLELQRVFVELSVNPEPWHEASPNPIPKLPARLQEGRHDIWEYLKVGRNLVLIGSPGSGKTTLLRHIALVLALRNHKMLAAKDIPRKLPILLFLRSHAREISANPDLSLPQLVESSEIVREMRPRPLTGWFGCQLEKGRCLVLLDGLDEVADKESRLRLVQWLQGQMRTYEKNLFLITSRPYGYRDNPLSSVHTLTVRPFSPEQVLRFVSNWYLANEIVSHNYDDPGVRKEGERGTRDLIRRINGSEVLTELAVNPLLLTMIATVHKYRSQLPGRRVELYREICEVFLGKRQDVRGVERPIDLTPGQKQCVLEPLAHYMMKQQMREITATVATDVIREILKRVSPQTTPEDFLKIVENTSGLLLERESGEYVFAHKTFQEYLTAVHCRNQNLDRELATRVKEDWWHETIRLYAAQSDATHILEACLEDDPPSPTALVLAVECIEEAQQVDERCRKQLEMILANEADDELHQKSYGQALLRLRLRKMVSLNEKSWVDIKLVTLAEYQVFLDEKRAKNQNCSPDHWTSPRFSAGEGSVPIAGIRASDAIEFCTWLTERDGAWKYRLPFDQELLERVQAFSDGRTELDQIGCWAYSLSLNRPVIAYLSAQTKEQVLRQLKSYVKESWVKDCATLNELTRWSPWSRFDSVLPIVLGLVNEMEQVLLYDRTIDSARELRPCASELEQSVERFFFCNLDGVLDTLDRLRIQLPRRRSFASCLDRRLPRSSEFMELIGPKRRLRRSDIEKTASRVRTIADELTRTIRNPEGIDEFLGFVFDADHEVGRDLEYARIGTLPDIALWMLRSNRTKVRVENDPIEEGVATLFDLYLQLSLIEGRIEKKLPAIGGMRVVRERLTET